MEIVNVGEPSAKPLSFINISELTLPVRNPGNVMHVEKPLAEVPPILHIRECVVERLFEFGETGKTHSIVQASAYVKASLQRETMGT